MANETTAPEENPANEIKDRIEAARAFAEEKYHQVREAADPYVEKARKYASDAREHINANWDETCAKAKEFHKAGEDYVRANPTGSVLGALGVGLILGLLLGSRN
ncbi:MAG: hypothetical protein Q4E43_08785 [Akkermansia sp.]|nr:hypothetical protein [Akkermansia sp.]